MNTTARAGLQATDISVRFGSVDAVRDATLVVEPGRVVALLGQNGAGKTSLLNAISGVIRPRRGSIVIDGRDVTRRGTAARLASGLCHVPEGRRLFTAETVLDNLRIGGFVRRRSTDVDAQIERMVDGLPMLRPHLHRPAGLLSGGQQQLVAIVRGLMSEPRHMLLDEPFSGLSPAARDDVSQLVRDIASDGTGVVLVEQLAAAALPVADDVVVMANGRLDPIGEASSLDDGQAIYDAYLGIRTETPGKEVNSA